MRAIPEAARWNMPSPDRLREQLPEIGAHLAAACETLHRYPNPDAAEHLARTLEGARQHALQLADGLRRESPDG